MHYCYEVTPDSLKVELGREDQFSLIRVTLGDTVLYFAERATVVGVEFRHASSRYPAEWLSRFPGPVM